MTNSYCVALQMGYYINHHITFTTAQQSRLPLRRLYELRVWLFKYSA